MSLFGQVKSSEDNVPVFEISDGELTRFNGSDDMADVVIPNEVKR